MSEATLIIENELPGDAQLGGLLSPHLETVSAKTVEEAIAAVQENPNISFIVMDLFLSETSDDMSWFDKGLGLLQDLRKLRPDLPVVIVSSPFGEESARIAEQYGVAGVLSKYDHELIAEIQELVSLHTAQDWRRSKAGSAPIKPDLLYLGPPNQFAFFGEIRDALLPSDIQNKDTVIVGSRAPLMPSLVLNVQSHVFISYVKEDATLVERLYFDLKAQGISVWRDRSDLSPGERWKKVIEKAIRTGSFFLACFSHNYYSRSSTYMNEELCVAIEELRRHPTSRTWFLPVLLSECQIPERSIGAGETLGDIQAVSLFKDWETGVRRIADVIAKEHERSRKGAHNTAPAPDC